MSCPYPFAPTPASAPGMRKIASFLCAGCRSLVNLWAEPSEPFPSVPPVCHECLDKLLKKLATKGGS